ncbi:NADH-quinone oxidoreductase subunit NuoE [bacterium]|nr:NADH-quinone oxidoreductase subunit NuoE [bacterium]
MPEYLAAVDEIASEYVGRPGSVIPVLQKVQERVGYLPLEVMRRIGERLDIPPAQIFGVASFYSQFRMTPVGRYIVKVCHGTACHVQGAGAITDAICDELKVADGGTTDDGKFTVESVACLGCCSLAPVIMVEGNAYGRLTPDEARRIVREYGE